MNYYIVKKLTFRIFVFSVVKFSFTFPSNFVKKILNSTLPGIFLGYDSNPSAYRIYVYNNQIILSRSIVFFKNIPGNCASPKSPPEFINFNLYYEIEGEDIHINKDGNNNIKDFNYINNNNSANDNNSDYPNNNINQNTNTIQMQLKVTIILIMIIVINKIIIELKMKMQITLQIIMKIITKIINLIK